MRSHICVTLLLCGHNYFATGGAFLRGIVAGVPILAVNIRQVAGEVRVLHSIIEPSVRPTVVASGVEILQKY
jgi:hypothetical protein